MLCIYFISYAKQCVRWLLLLSFIDEDTEADNEKSLDKGHLLGSGRSRTWTQGHLTSKKLTHLTTEPHQPQTTGRTFLATSRWHCLPTTLASLSAPWSGRPETVYGGGRVNPKGSGASIQRRLRLCLFCSSVDSGGKCNCPKSSVCLVQEIIECHLWKRPLWTQPVENALRDNKLETSQPKMCPLTAQVSDESIWEPGPSKRSDYFPRHTCLHSAVIFNNKAGYICESA